MAPILRALEPIGAQSFRLGQLFFVLPDHAGIIDVLAGDAPEMNLILRNASREGASRALRRSAIGRTRQEE
jgi:hypothetical protein